MKLHRGFIDIFSLWEFCQSAKRTEQLCSYKKSAVLPLLFCLTAKGMGWSHNFPSEKLSSNMHLGAEEDLGILYPPSSRALRPVAQTGLCRPQAQMNKYFQIFLFALFCFSVFHFCFTFYIQTVFFTFSLCIQSKRTF